jgi:Family of unknown function (DUF6518)
MGAAMTAYYAYQALLFGYFPQRLWLAWLVLSVVAVPVWAAGVFRARGSGWWSALAASAPVGLLLAEAWSQQHSLGRHLALALFDGTAAVALLVLLPRSARQRLRGGGLDAPGGHPRDRGEHDAVVGGGAGLLER